MKSLELYLREKWSLSSRDCETISSHFEEITISNNEYLLREGEICEYLFFAPSGTILSFNQQTNSKLKTKFFTVGPYLFTSSSSLASKNSSSESIIAHANFRLFRLHIDDHQNLLQTKPFWSGLIRKLLIEVQQLTEEILLASSEQSPQERFLNLIDQQPIIVQKVPQKMIASFLGIAPESLSRIKKSIYENRKR